MGAFLIQDIYNIAGIGIIAVGQIKSGILKIGMKINLDGRIMEVKSIEMYHMQVKEAKEGDNVGIALSNSDSKILRNFIGKPLTFS